MRLADALTAAAEEALAVPRTTAKCPVRRAIDELDEDDVLALVNLVSDRRLDATIITRKLNDLGGEMLGDATGDVDDDERRRLEYVGEIFSRMRSDSIRRHRRGACACTREASA